MFQVWLIQSVSFAQKTEIRVEDLRKFDYERWNIVKLFTENDYSAQMLEVQILASLRKTDVKRTCRTMCVS